MTRKRQRDLIEQAWLAYGAVLRAFPKLANGLTPDAVKVTPEYRTAKANLDYAFKQLRAINAQIVKESGDGKP